MKSDSELLKELYERRALFHHHFPMIRIGRRRVDVDSFEILKNTCPACGYLTLTERDSFEICPICFWEDDGLDDFEEDTESGPNHVTLKEYRLETVRLIGKLKSIKTNDSGMTKKISNHLKNIDSLIFEFTGDKTDKIKDEINSIILILERNEIYGIGKLS